MPFFGGFVLLSAALISIFSIFGRVVFFTPILGDFELVEIACAVAIGSFLPLCHLKNGNVVVDFITANLSKNKINILDATSSLIFGCVALFFSCRMILGAQDMYMYKEETNAFSISYLDTFFTSYFIFFSAYNMLFLYL